MKSKFWTNLELVDKVGEGNFGTVYKAKDKNGQIFAIKHISLPREPQEIEMLIQNGVIKGAQEANNYYVSIMKKEIEIMSKFNGSPYVINFYDFYQKNDPTGTRADYYIKMEYSEDITKKFNNQKIDVNEIVKLGIDVCHALELCSSINIIHNDIKPENIFIGNDGKYKLGDFNISVKNNKDANNFLTPNYVSPEIYLGESANTSTDLYSLGLVMYKLIFGELPFKTKNNSENKAFELRMDGNLIPVIEGLDAALMRILSKACSYNVDSRYKNATEMRQDLEKLQHIDFVGNTVVFSTSRSENTVGIYEVNSIFNKNNDNKPKKLLYKLKGILFDINNIKTILKVIIVIILVLLLFRNCSLKKNCNIGYINKNGTCVKGYYYCEAGYVLNADNKCQKTVESVDAKVTYTCKSGYTLNGETCVSNDVRDVEFVYKCADGFTLNGTKCERVESADALVTYSCPSEYVSAGDQCVKISNMDATVQNACKDSSYILSGNMCTKTITQSVKATQEYTCDSNGTLNGTVCDYVVEPIYSWPYYKASCSKGNYNYFDRKCHYSESAKITNSCTQGTLDASGNCIYNETITEEATQKYSCPSGYTAVGNQCAKTTGVPATTKYICPDSAVLRGGKCYTTISTDAVGMYDCAEGYVASGTGCYKNDFPSAIKKYTCSKVYTLNGDKCEKYKVIEPNAHYDE